MGRGDKKTTKGKRSKGSYGNTRNRKKIKAALKKSASKKAGATEAKPKARKVAAKKD